MAEKAKEKKIDVRDIAYDQVASAIMQDSKLAKIRRHKEGLELTVNGELFAVRVIKKKDELDAKEFRGEYFHDEKENSFSYKSYKTG
jgi:hypothetical protein